MRSFVPLSRASALLLGLGVLSASARAEPGPSVTTAPATQPALAAEEEADEAAEATPLAPAPAAPELSAQPDDATSAGESAQLSPPEVSELAARLQALERIDPLDDSVRRPVEFGRAALERARASRAARDAQAELRTLRLARAAVELAEARLRLARERTLFLATQARGNASTAEQATAKRAVERERARARELERESAAP